MNQRRKKQKMNTFRKIRKNAKALSPVVASIILIAVTVAVSVAVAAWMGGMTVGFMGTSSITVTNVVFTPGDAGAGVIDLDLKNTGTKAVTIAQVRVNNELATSADLPLSIKPGDSDTLQLTGITILEGNTYKADLYDSNNQVVGSVQANAPDA
jgi:flagellin-like protein